MKNETLPRLVIQVDRWAGEKGIYAKATPLAQAHKTLEEALELAEAIRNEDRHETIDALGDVMVTCIIGCRMQGIEPEDALQAAFDVISKRTGRMINGTFIKDA